ncbi:hypothetical protein B0J17DRAFT_719226 [Rhizoctonia solani]|nr:hypothetical protein B0J17DRAFT_719226 [Rhizoctonia solani]
MSGYPFPYTGLDNLQYEHGPGSSGLTDNGADYVGCLDATYPNSDAARWQDTPQLHDHAPFDYNHTPIPPGFYSSGNPYDTPSVRPEDVYASDATRSSTSTIEQGTHSINQVHFDYYHDSYAPTQVPSTGKFYYAHTGFSYSPNPIEAPATIAPAWTQPGEINEQFYLAADDYSASPDNYSMPHTVVPSVHPTLASLGEPSLSSGQVMVDNQATGLQTGLTRRRRPKKLEKAVRRIKIKKLKQCPVCNKWLNPKRSNWDARAYTFGNKTEKVTKDQIVVHYIRRHLGIPYDLEPLPEDRAKAILRVVPI